MQIHATRDAISMADDMRSDDKSLDFDFDGNEVKDLLAFILTKANFLAFASDTKYQIYSGAKQIARIHDYKVIMLEEFAALKLSDLQTKNGQIQLHFRPYAG